MSPPRKPFLWVTDPWDMLDHARDTTLRLAREAKTLGCRCHWADLRSIRWEEGRVLVDSREILKIPESQNASEIVLSAPEPRSPSLFGAIHYRVDPPVDLHYLHPLQILLLEVSESKIVNPPSSLFMTNEKLEGACLSDLTPPSIVSGDWQHLLRFGKAEGKTVIKPLHHAQSKGVELLDWRNPEGIARAEESIRNLTNRGCQPVLLQRYLPGIEEGEKRLWFVDGKLIAYAKKLPVPNDFRVNIDAGSQIRPTELSATEKKAARRISQLLKNRKIRLAAVDLIEHLITDFNFTSPGLIVQMEAVLGKNLARPIIRELMR